MEELEKKIEEASKVGASYPCEWNIGYQVGFEKGALSPEAKALHTQGMYTEIEAMEAYANQSRWIAVEDMMAFVCWYSGMELHKVKNAYERYLREQPFPDKQIAPREEEA